MGVGSAFQAGYASGKKDPVARKPMSMTRPAATRKPVMAAATPEKKKPKGGNFEESVSKGSRLASHGSKGSSLATKRE